MKLTWVVVEMCHYSSIFRKGNNMSKKFKILIDAGHMPNYNRGSIAGYYEGNTMFYLAQYLAKELEVYDNIDIVLTRNKITDAPSLATRGKMAKGFDLFISLHSNADDGSGKATGVTILDSVSKPSKSIAETIGRAVAKVMNTNFRRVVYRKNSAGTDYYGVLRHSSAVGCKTCILVEHGFHTNKVECAFLMVDDNLKKIAKVEAETIAQIFGLKKKVGESKYYRVRKTWVDAKSQLGAYVSLENAKHVADKNEGFSVFDWNGNVVHTGKNVKDEPEVNYHVVEKGDTLWGISHEYSMTVDELKKLNGLTSNIIHVGDKLRLNSNVKAEKPVEKKEKPSVEE